MNQPTSRPNILLITTDQQRFETLGCNGSDFVKTPNIDGLASQGVNFSHAYCNNPVCIPSRASIQTGRYTHQHGVRYMENRLNDTPGLPWWEKTFMERLRDGAYDTGGFGKIDMRPPHGFNQAKLTNGQGARWLKPYGSKFGPSQLGDDYANWLENKNPGAYEKIYDQRRTEEYKKYMSAVTSVLEYDETVVYWAMENTRNFITQDRNTPFFAWLGFCNPHGPLDTPRDYASMYDPNDIVLSEKYLNRPDKTKGPSEEVLRRWIAHYYALCTMIDDLCKEVFDALKESDQWENTLISYTCDHGEMMGDWGTFGKGNFFEAVINVPLIIKASHSTEAKSFSGLTESIDIAPTILEYAQLPIPKTIEGKSLQPILEGNGSGKEQILSEYVNNDRSRQGKCIRTEHYKYVLWSPDEKEELYDLQDDPSEWNNLAEDEKSFSKLADMRKRLARHLMDSEKPILPNT